MTDTTATLFRETAPALSWLGWRPIPLAADTKEPAEPGWNKFNGQPWDERELEIACGYYTVEACGIALPLESLAVDLDILDPDAAAEAEHLADHHLGETPLLRIGQAPKSVRLYRADGSVRGSKPHPVELYCGTGQVAVFGWHPKAGRPYQWPCLSPLEVAADSSELPLVTGTRVRAFLAALQPLLSRLRAIRARHGGAGIGRDAGEYLRSLLTRGLRFADAASYVLWGAVDGGRHYAIRAVVSSAFNRGMSADEIAALIERHAPPELLRLVVDDGYLERALADFAPCHSSNRWKIQ